MTDVTGAPNGSTLGVWQSVPFAFAPDFSPIPLHFAGNYGIVVMALPVTVGGPAPFCGGSFLAPDFTEGGDPMVTYSELFQFVMMLTAVIALILQVCNYKKK